MNRRQEQEAEGRTRNAPNDLSPLCPAPAICLLPPASCLLLGVLASWRLGSMSIGIIRVNHVNVTVPATQETAAKHFYNAVLGLEEIPKPEGTRQNIGAWYQLNGVQLHLSIEDDAHNETSDRHVCYQVADIAVADREFRNAGVEIIPDPRPVAGQSRFFVRDPGGNLIEITQAVN